MIEGTERFKLDEHEVNGLVFQKLLAHLKNRLDCQRKKNDKSISPEQTEKLRGRIAELNYMISLASPDLPYESDDPGH